MKMDHLRSVCEAYATAKSVYHVVLAALIALHCLMNTYMGDAEYPPAPYSYYPYSFYKKPPPVQFLPKEYSYTTRTSDTLFNHTHKRRIMLNGKANQIGVISGPIGGLHDYVLECRAVSYIRSFTTGQWYTKAINPPITAQFLKDINLELHAGEMMGVIGSGGSGKTTLLNVIARRVQGTTGGSILLNHRPLNTNSFHNNCAYVSFKQTLIEQLTVKETLRFQADLSLASSFSSKEKQERVTNVMRDFELMHISHKRIEDLTESDRRRLIIAYHLIRDPLLILVDEPTADLDALSSYQLMYDLFQYCKRQRRMIIVTQLMPRSDIYQLFDRLTILFFGEVVYSGYTKQMPAYFRQIGFPCPASENPAIYYLSLATVDRETSDRYVETQEQAVRLIEIFKGQGEPFSHYASNATNIDQYSGANPYLPLSRLGRPGPLSKIFTLTRRNVSTLFARRSVFFGRLLALPLFCLLLAVFHLHTPHSATSPYSRAGLLFSCMAAASLVAVPLAASTVAIHRLRFYQENWDNLYGGVVFVLSQMLSTFLIDLVTVFGATAILFWSCEMGETATDYLIFSGLLWCCFELAQLTTTMLLVCVRSTYKAACSTATLLIVLLTFSGGFLKALKTFSTASSWLYYLSYAMPYKYTAAALYSSQLNNWNTTCVPTTVDDIGSGRKLCRWASGADYLKEVYNTGDVDDFWLNFGVSFGFVAVAAIATIVVYSIPLPHPVKRKFRFK